MMSGISLFIIANRHKLFIVMFQKQKKIISEESNFNNQFSEHFFQKINETLKAQNLTLSQVNNIYSGIGPGSFLIHRTIITFLKTIKILNKELKIFIINNLIYQTGKEKEVISLIEANKKQYYIKIINNNSKEINKFNKIQKEDLNIITKKYSEYNIYKDLEGFDHWEKFQKMRNNFQEILNWKKLKSIEL